MATSSSQLKRSPIPPRASATFIHREIPQEELERITQELPRTYHPLFPLAVGMLLVSVVLCIWFLIIIPIFTKITQQFEYGSARITRVTSDVGHGGNSEFLGWDEHGAVVVVEFIDNHPDKTHVYTGLTVTSDGGGSIVGITIEDVNADGKPDLVVTIGRSQLVLVNTGSEFSWVGK